MIYYCLWSKGVFYDETKKGYNGDLTKTSFFDITDNRKDFINQAMNINDKEKLNLFLSGLLSSYVKRRASICHGEDYLKEYYVDWLDYTKRYTINEPLLKKVYDWCIEYEQFIRDNPNSYE